MAFFPVLRRKADQQASTLSGGEQKMLEIARSLLLEPKLILIDEPSIGLSPMMVQSFSRSLKNLRDQRHLDPDDRAECEAARSQILPTHGIVLELGRTRIDRYRRGTSSPTRASVSFSLAVGWRRPHPEEPEQSEGVSKDGPHTALATILRDARPLASLLRMRAERSRLRTSNTTTSIRVNCDRHSRRGPFAGCSSPARSTAPRGTKRRPPKACLRE